jgi:hypothetical protein
MKIKGTGWQSVKKYVKESYSAAEIERLRAALDDDLREFFDSKTILAISWVDYSLYMRFLIKADRVLGKGDFEFIRQANYYSARHDINGVYKIVISLMSPKTAIGAFGKLMMSYYDRGKLTIERLESNRATIVLEDVPDIPRHHDVDQGAFIEEVLRMAGASNISWSHPKCMARGDDCCLGEISWSNKK